VPREAREWLRTDIQEAIGRNMLTDEDMVDSVRAAERIHGRRLSAREVRGIREHMESIDDIAILGQLRALKRNVEFRQEIRQWTHKIRAQVEERRKANKCCVVLPIGL
jgi:hypothetical protein